jgi:hypothetical protein
MGGFGTKNRPFVRNPRGGLSRKPGRGRGWARFVVDTLRTGAFGRCGSSIAGSFFAGRSGSRRSRRSRAAARPAFIDVPDVLAKHGGLPSVGVDRRDFRQRRRDQERPEEPSRDEDLRDRMELRDRLFSVKHDSLTIAARPSELQAICPVGTPAGAAPSASEPRLSPGAENGLCFFEAERMGARYASESLCEDKLSRIERMGTEQQRARRPAPTSFSFD